ncbi:WD40 repeat domain-containing protein [Bythopirellula goksoeyrii]|uniref:WD domain, G-beta repeat n=1 Tax=Bythopirellula goksoeyrii TaxID=1400387 RepID=A0A5B9QDP4_9BACT|nr:hypothetical protein [Bythopirellula goksoeyrii]QEG35919.1 WD domain, G-beta repeat [Bythopirellula goksoeyrii]
MDPSEESRRRLESELIHARPIGRVARSWSWVKRNRAVSALGSALVVSLLIALVVSTILLNSSQEALRQRELALKATDNALQQELKAKEAEAQLETARAESGRLKEANVQAWQQALNSEIAGKFARANSLLHDLETIRREPSKPVNREKARQTIRDISQLAAEAHVGIEQLDPNIFAAEILKFREQGALSEEAIRSEATRWLEFATLRQVKEIPLEELGSVKDRPQFQIDLEKVIHVGSNSSGSVVVVGRANREKVAVIDNGSDTVRFLRLEGVRFAQQGMEFGPGIVNTMTVAPDGSQLVVLDYSPRLLVFDLVQGKKLNEWKLPDMHFNNYLVCAKQGEVQLQSIGNTNTRQKELTWQLEDGTHSERQLADSEISMLRFHSPWHREVQGTLFDAIWNSRHMGPESSNTLKLRERGDQPNEITIATEKHLGAFGFAGDPNWLVYCVGNRLNCYDHQSGITLGAEYANPTEFRQVVKLCPAPRGFYAIVFDNVTTDSFGSQTRQIPPDRTKGQTLSLAVWKADFGTPLSQQILPTRCRDLKIASDGLIVAGGEGPSLVALANERELWDSSKANIRRPSANFQRDGQSTFTVDSIEGQYPSWRTEIRSSQSGELIKEFPASGVGNALRWDATRRFAVLLESETVNTVSYEVLDVQEDKVLGQLGPFDFDNGDSSGKPVVEFSPRGRWLLITQGEVMKLWEIPSLKYAGSVKNKNKSPWQNQQYEIRDIRNNREDNEFIESEIPDFREVYFDQVEDNVFVRPLRSVYNLPSMKRVAKLADWPDDEFNLFPFRVKFLGTRIFLLADRSGLRDRQFLVGVWDLETGQRYTLGDSTAHEPSGVEVQNNADRPLRLGETPVELANKLADPSTAEAAIKELARKAEAAFDAIAEDREVVAADGNSAENGAVEEGGPKETAKPLFRENSMAIVHPSGEKVLILMPFKERMSFGSSRSSPLSIYLWDLKSGEYKMVGSYANVGEFSLDPPVVSFDEDFVYLKLEIEEEKSESDHPFAQAHIVRWSDGKVTHSGKLWKDGFNRLLVWKDDEGLSVQVIPGTVRTPLEHSSGAVPGRAHLSPDHSTIVLQLDLGNRGAKRTRIAGMWSSINGKRLVELPASISSVTFDPKSRWCVVTNNDKEELMIVDCESGQIQRRLSPPWLLKDVIRMADDRVPNANSPPGYPIGYTPSYGLDNIRIDPTGSRLLLNGYGLTALWDAEQNKEIKRLKKSHHAPINCVAQDPRGRFIATGGVEGGVIIWDRKTGKYVRSYVEYVGSIVEVSFDNKGDRLFALSSNGTLSCLGQHGWQVRSKSKSTAQTFACHPSEPIVAVGTEAGEILFLSMRDGKQSGTLRFEHGDLTSLDYTSDGKFLAAGCKDGSIVVWDVSTKKERCQMNAEGPIVSLRWLIETGTLVSGGQTIEIWDVDRATSIWSIPITKAPVRAMDLNRIRDQLVIADGGGAGRLIDLRGLNSAIAEMGVLGIELPRDVTGVSGTTR